LNPTFHSTALVTAAAGSVEKAYQGMEREKQEEYGEVGRGGGREGGKEGGALAC
jgi:hypothetical protein